MTEQKTPNLERPLSKVKAARLHQLEPGEHRVHELQPGCWVVELHDRTLIHRDAIEEWAVTRFKSPTTNPTTGATIMSDRISYDSHLAADAAEGWLLKHDPATAAVSQKIGSKATTMRDAKKVADLWTALLRDNTLGYVTLDVDPEIPGRPRSMRPATPAVLFVELPDWWPGTPNEVAVVYYWPTSSWMTDPDPVTEVRTELASYRNGVGARAILYTFKPASLDDVDQRIEEGRRAVAAVAVGRVEDMDPETLEAERLEVMKNKFRSIARM